MKNIFSLFAALLISGCASLSSFSERDKMELAELSLKQAIAETKSDYDCGVEYFFVAADGVNVNSEFLSKFSYPGISILPDSESTASCETGITRKGTSSRGYAFSVFEIKNLKPDLAKVKWGHWYSCKDFSYKYTIFKKTNGIWSQVSTEK